MNLKSLFLTFSALPMLGFGLPSGAIVEHGQADFHAPHASQLEVSCHDRTVINWDTFNIDSHEALKFIQSQGDAVLNRVTGHESGLQMSQIMGTLSSQGSVYIVNPEGILIGSNALIDVASFVATTLDISSSDFLKLQSEGSKGEGLQSLVLSGDSKAKILNLGTIKAASGDVHVVAYQVDNQGSIEATQGTVTLAATNEAVLQPAGKKKVLIRTRVNANSTDESTEAELADEGVSNSGVIKALEVDIGADGSLYKLAINHTGHIEAKTLTEEGGKIFLTSEKGSITVDGTMTAKESIDGVEKGGHVEVMGERVALSEKANIDVSGKHGGGTALFGSDTRGEGTAFNAQHTTVAEGSFVNASATENGDGGKVIYWGDDLVNYHGSTLAEGGFKGGDGGFVEVSSHGAGFNKFVYTGQVSTLAPKGKIGTLLWDPTDVTISGSTTSGATEIAGDPITYTFSGSTATINAGVLDVALGTSNVEIATDNIQGGAGNVTFSGTQTYDSTNRLTITTPTSAKVEFIGATITGTNLYMTINTGELYIDSSTISLASFLCNLTHSNTTSYLTAGTLTAGQITIRESPSITGITGCNLRLGGWGSSLSNFGLVGNSTVGSVNIEITGDLTLHGHADASITDTKITNQFGTINLGTESKPLGSVTLRRGSNVTEGSSVYIGEPPDATSEKVSELKIYTSGNIEMTSEHASDEFSIGTYAAPLTLNVGGDVTMANGGGVIQIRTDVNNSSDIGDATINITGNLGITSSAGSNTISLQQSNNSHEFNVGSISMSSEAGSSAINITPGFSHDTVFTCSGSAVFSGPSSIFAMNGTTVATLNIGTDLTLTNTHFTMLRKLVVDVGRDITLNGSAYIQTIVGSPELRVLAGREVILNDSSYLSSGSGSGDVGNLIVVTDNNNPSSPDVGIGNLTMASGASLSTGDNAGEIYVFAGYEENNQADINDSAEINGVTYGTLEGTVDEVNNHKRFGVYYDANSLPSGYNSRALFLYKALTPTETITAGATEGANEVASAATSSSSLSIGAGISTLNNLRDRYITPTKSFHRQYSHMKKNPRTEGKPNKRPKKDDEK